MRFGNLRTTNATSPEQALPVDWLYRLAVAIICGGANAVLGGLAINFIDPDRFNAHSMAFYKIVFALFLANAAISMFMHFKRKSSPSAPGVAVRVQLEPWSPKDHRGRHLRLVSGSKRT